MTYTEFIIEIENNIAKANCDKLNIGEYEEKQKQIYKQIRADAIDDFAILFSISIINSVYVIYSAPLTLLLFFQYYQQP